MMRDSRINFKAAGVKSEINTNTTKIHVGRGSCEYPGVDEAKGCDLIRFKEGDHRF